ncbi:MAG: PIN domain-containing protein [Nitrospira sp.]|nr:MAG: PIN domain-containing protein [Nitrospira sp.]
MVIADTSVWIPFFNRPDSPEKAALDLLIDADEVVLVGVVLAELLQGCRASSERETLSEALLALPYYEVTQSTWSQTGDLSAQLLRKGLTLPLSDLIIAALAIEHHCPVYSLDTHFKKIPGVRLYLPASRRSFS